MTEGFCGTIGSTRLIRIPSLSTLTGCDIFGKAEFLNPGGSIKDRTAKWMLEAALAKGDIKEGGLVIEATSGNTGVGLAHVCRAKHLRCIFVCPTHVSEEKVKQLMLLGAEKVVRVERLPTSDPGNYQNVAKRMAAEMGGVCLDQYNNLSNMQAHIESTGPEIWEQTQGNIDALVLASGTGGTIAGCSVFLKEKNPKLKVVLANVKSAGVTVKDGTVGESELVEKNKLKSSITLREMAEEEKIVGTSTVLEGIGSSALFGNLSHALVDEILPITDEAGIQMCHYMLKKGKKKKTIHNDNFQNFD